MAITLVNSAIVIADSTNQTGAATYTGSYTVGSGTDRYVAVTLHGYNTVGGELPTSLVVTLGGVAMSVVSAAQTMSDGNQKSWEAIYGIVAPAAGSSTLSVSFDITGGTRALGAIASEMDGVDQSTPVHGVGRSGSIGTSDTQTVYRTTANDGALVLTAWVQDGGGDEGTTSVGAPGTLVQKGSTGGTGFNDCTFLSSYVITATAGSANHTITSIAEKNSLAWAEFIPAVGVGGGTDTVSGGTASADSAVSAPGLAQNHVLAPTPISADSAVSAPGLGQDRVMVPATISADSASSGGGIEQDHVLSASAAVAESTADGPALNQDHVLSPIPISADSVAYPSSIGSNHSIAAGSISADSAMESGGITVNVPIVSGTISADSAVSSPDLGQDHVFGGHTIVADSLLIGSEIGQDHVLQSIPIWAESALIGTTVVSVKSIQIIVIRDLAGFATASDLKSISSHTHLRGGL